jgi:hypothetical protein
MPFISKDESADWMPTTDFEIICRRTAQDERSRELMGHLEYRQCFTDNEHFWAIVWENFPTHRW